MMDLTSGHTLHATLLVETGSEAYCVDDNYEGSIANEECMDAPSDLNLNGGSNGHCAGPYVMDGLISFVAEPSFTIDVAR